MSSLEVVIQSDIAEVKRIEELRVEMRNPTVGNCEVEEERGREKESVQ